MIEKFSDSGGGITSLSLEEVSLVHGGTKEEFILPPIPTNFTTAFAVMGAGVGFIVLGGPAGTCVGLGAGAAIGIVLDMKFYEI